MGNLHILLFPMVAHGHMIPTLDMAKLFTSRGLQATIISTPAFAEPIKSAQISGFNIGLEIIRFPPEQSELPDHIVSLDQVTSEVLIPNFFKALDLLQDPLEHLIRKLKPDCLVSDMFLPWTVNCAAKFDIPRLVFHGISYLSLCCLEQMKRHRPFENLVSDEEQFVLPDLPHELKFVRTQVADYLLEENEFTRIMQRVRDSDERSYGVVVNSFCELEPDYADYYRRVLGRKAWNIGPLLLHNHGDKGKTERGKKSSIDTHECLAWLDTKRPDSVVYVCFGSMANFTKTQLHEIATGLEITGRDFVWVVRKTENDKESDEFLPDGFADRTKGRGLIINGWAPQVTILGHEAIGAFVTHCGWNSTLEGVCAGVPMVTWPLFAEQFFNEKLVTRVLRIGVPVGNTTWRRVGSEGIGRDAVAKAVEVVMAGESGSDMRSRVRYYKEMAGRAVEQGGSSYKDMSCLIEELREYSRGKNNDVSLREVGK